jgi:hypothetical protein
MSHSSKRWDTLKSGDFYIDLTENEHHQILLPDELPKFEGVDSWNISNEGRRHFYTKETGEADDNPTGRSKHAHHINRLLKIRAKVEDRNALKNFFKQMRSLPDVYPRRKNKLKFTCTNLEFEFTNEMCIEAIFWDNLALSICLRRLRKTTNWRIKLLSCKL